MQITMIPIGGITPYENNPRKNNQAVEKVASSISSFGFQSPIVVDKDNVIICGHTRYQAAMLLDMQEVPVIVAAELNDEQVKAYRIMDNRSSELADWDDNKLLKELLDLQETDYDLLLAGFDEVDFERLKLDVGSTLPDVDLGAALEGGDDDEITSGTREKAYIIQYNIVFNEESEQAEWHKFLLFLKEAYPELETISERLVKHIKDGGFSD